MNTSLHHHTLLYSIFFTSCLILQATPDGTPRRNPLQEFHSRTHPNSNAEQNQTLYHTIQAKNDLPSNTNGNYCNFSEHRKQCYLNYKKQEGIEQALQDADINGKIALLIKTIRNDMLNLPDITSDILEATLSRIPPATDPNHPQNNKSPYEVILEDLIFQACLQAACFNVSQTINATKACLTIDTIIQEIGPIMHSYKALFCMLHVNEVHTTVGAIKATGLDCTHPKIAAQLIAGNDGCYLYIVQPLHDTFTHLDPRCREALRDLNTSISNSGRGITRTITHSLKIPKKIIVATDKIVRVLNDYVCNDISFRVIQDTLWYREDHESLSRATQRYLCDCITRLKHYNVMPMAADACSTVHTLSPDQIKTAFSEAETPIDLHKTPEQLLTLHNTIGLGLIAKQVTAEVLGNATEALDSLDHILEISSAIPGIDSFLAEKALP